VTLPLAFSAQLTLRDSTETVYNVLDFDSHKIQKPFATGSTDIYISKVKVLSNLNEVTAQLI
jgi:hypothetical protein